MKKFTVAFLAASIAFSLSACSGNEAGKETTNDNNQTQQTASNNEDSSNGESNKGSSQVSGENIELDGYSVFVPSNWVSIPASDNKSVKLYKTDDANNIFGVPEIDITYNVKGTYSLVTAIFDSYEDIEPISIGGYTWEGVKGAYDSSKDVLSLNTSVGEGYISADIWVKVNDTTISVDDDDVKAIMEGISVSGESSSSANENSENADGETADGVLYNNWFYASIPEGYTHEDGSKLFMGEDKKSYMFEYDAGNKSAADMVEKTRSEHDDWTINEPITIGDFEWYPIDFMYGDLPKQRLFANYPKGGYIKIEISNMKIDEPEVQAVLKSFSVKE